MNKLLIISGPTATGKTDLAVKIAQKLNGELVSADSRQIYQGLEIGVGKDHPAHTPINLIDITTPDKTFSVAEFKQSALKTISAIWAKGKLPILVGCSGYYIDSIINPNYSTFEVKPNSTLRFFLEKFPRILLRTILFLIDNKTYRQLNNSDVNNPRRLVRKIEIKISKFNNLKLAKNNKFKIENYSTLHLSLTAPNKFIYDHIDKRVEERLKMGHLDELKKLLKKYQWSDPGLKVSAYQVFKDYFNSKISLKKTSDLWKYAEHRDARHQKTWFKKYSEAIFIDVSKKNYQPTAVSLVTKWYNKL